MSLNLKANVLASAIADSPATLDGRLCAASLFRASEATVTASADTGGGEKENAYAEGFTFDFWRPGSSGTHWLRASIAAGVVADEHWSVAAQTTDPRDVAMSNDGLHMYVLGAAKVFAFTLRIPFDPSSAKYDGAGSDLTVSGQDTDPRGLAISNGGAFLYVVGATGDAVYSWTMSTAYMLATASYVSGADLDVSGDDLTPEGIAVASTGLKLYIVGSTGDAVYSWTMSTAFDLSTATTDAADDLDVSGQDLTPVGLAINDAGTVLWVLGSTGGKAYKYRLDTAYGLGTASYLGTSFDLDVSTEDATPTGMSLTPDGAKLYAIGSTVNKTQAYTVGAAANYLGIAAHDLHNHGAVVYSQSLSPASFSVNGQDITPLGLDLSPDGSRMFVAGNDSNTIYSFTLEIPGDLSTAEYDGVAFDLDVSGQDGTPTDVTISSDGFHLVMIGGSNKKAFFYTMTAALDLRTATHDGAPDDIDVSAQDASPAGIVISSDGLHVYVCGSANIKVYGWTLGVAYDGSSAVYDAGDDLDTSGQDTSPTALALSTDGTRLFVLGQTGDTVDSYTMGPAFDLGSAASDGATFTLDVSSQDTSPQGLWVDSDGLGLFMLGNINDSVFAYVMSAANDLRTAVNLSWVKSAGPFTPRTSEPILLLFDDVVSLNHRLLFTVTSAPSIGAVQIGAALKLDSPIRRDYTPPTLARADRHLPSMAEGGQFLGRTVISEGTALDLPVTAVSMDWIRAQWESHARIIEQYPFFWSAQDAGLIDDVAETEAFYGWVTQQPASSYEAGVYGGFNLQARGIVS